MSKELEVLVKIEEPEKEVWKKVEVIEREKIKDIYFDYPLIVLRVREVAGEFELTFKEDVFRGKKWQYAKEYEVLVEKDIITILKKMGYLPTIAIEMEKFYCTGGLEIQKVKGLGLFLEVEGKNRKEIWRRIKKTGIKVSQELEVGKPELMFRKLKKSNLKKVYCDDCLWRGNSTWMYWEWCEYPDRKEFASGNEFVGKKGNVTLGVSAKRKIEINGNGECPFYKPSQWKKIKDWIKSLKK